MRGKLGMLFVVVIGFLTLTLMPTCRGAPRLHVKPPFTRYHLTKFHVASFHMLVYVRVPIAE
jgi:hypothetical protein